MTSPFAFLFLTFLWWIFTVHSLPPTSTSPSVQTFFSVHFSPHVWLSLDTPPPCGASLDWTEGDEAFAPARTSAFPWDLSLFFHTSVSKDVAAVLFTAKHQPSSRIWPPFLMILCFYTPFCGKEQHVTWWHWLLSNVKRPLLQRPIFYFSAYAVL